ncbi:MAG: GNAT family N-acetyltransferase [Cognatishimia sp.]
MIRPFQTDDTDALLVAWRKASELAHPFLSQDFLDQSDQAIRDIYLPKAETWVAELNGTPVGFIALLGNMVGGLFLHPDHHGAGIGRALMDHAVRQHGDLTVEVFRDNAIGRAFYAAYGFTELKEFIDDYAGLPTLELEFRA